MLARGREKRRSQVPVILFKCVFPRPYKICNLITTLIFHPECVHVFLLRHARRLTLPSKKRQDTREYKMLCYLFLKILLVSTATDSITLWGARWRGKRWKCLRERVLSTCWKYETKWKLINLVLSRKDRSVSGAPVKEESPVGDG